MATTNLSEIDDMPNITSNFTDDVYEHHESPYERIFLEMFTLVGLLSVLCNFFMIFVILKYKKMREDATNMIFLHINILQAVYLFATPLTLRVAMAFFHMSPVHMAVFCVSYQIESSVVFIITWFFMLLVCDWCLKLYYKDKYVKFCRLHKFFVVGLYVIFIAFCSVTIQGCFKYMMSLFTYLIMFAAVILLVIFLIIMSIVHAFRKRKLLTISKKGTFGFAVTNITFACWAPSVLYAILGIFFRLNTPILIIFLISLGFASPIFNLVYLYYYDDYYNVFLKQVFKCRCNDYNNENLEDQSVTYNDSNGVKITVT